MIVINHLKLINNNFNICQTFNKIRLHIIRITINRY